MRISDPFHPDAEPWLRLVLAHAVPPRKLHGLLRALGSPGAIFDCPRQALRTQLDEEEAQALLSMPPPQALEAARRWLAQPGCHLVTQDDDRYPRLLREIADPPCAFFARGRVELLAGDCLAIVGSRNATPQGLGDAHDLAREVSDAGVVVVSGLALGIDGAAHRGGLAGNASTIAVMGTGPDRVYPRAHRGLCEEIAERGCLVTEFPLGTPPFPWNFPRRNRLISGLSRGVLVVEAAIQSGSLGTARAAAEQNRDVFAVPGSIHSTLAKGCHLLIQEGAKLVECGNDILEELGIESARGRARAETQPQPRGDETLEALGFAPASLEHLAQRSGLDAATLAARLSRLEIAGLVRALPGGRFQRVE